jgi:hypothetical protein
VLRLCKTAILLAIAIAIQACALPPKPGLDQMLATAKTPYDHEAIAKYYENEAAEAQAVQHTSGGSAITIKGFQSCTARDSLKITSKLNKRRRHSLPTTARSPNSCNRFLGRRRLPLRQVRINRDKSE